MSKVNKSRESQPCPRGGLGDSASVSFVPIELTDVRRVQQLEIERAGVVIRVREDLDVVHVARLVAALAAAEHPC